MSDEITTRYVWLNIATGKFSNSWSEEDMPDGFIDKVVEDADKEWKLIKYECVNDEVFNFNRGMKLQ